MSKPTTVEAYIDSFPEGIQIKLKSFRAIILETAPEAAELISYGMPYYALEGRLVYFGAHTHHLGFYPMPAAIQSFKEELKDYVCSKGAIQFPYDRPFPKKLIKAIIQYRIKENKAKIKTKKNEAKILPLFMV